MNIEDIIRAVNPVRPGDVEDALSPGAQHTLARVLQSDATPGVANGRAPRAHRSSVPPGLHSRHGPPSSRPRKRKLIMISLAAVAAGATAAGLVLAVPGAARRPAPTAAPGPKAHPSATSATPQYTSARQVLLTAAANVASAPASGQVLAAPGCQGDDLAGRDAGASVRHLGVGQLTTSGTPARRRARTGYSPPRKGAVPATRPTRPPGARSAPRRRGQRAGPKASAPAPATCSRLEPGREYCRPPRPIRSQGACSRNRATASSATWKATVRG